MKKLACIAGLCMFAALTGCANDTNNRGIYEKAVIH